MKKIYQLFLVVVMLGAVPMFTSCSDMTEEHDNPSSPKIATISITADDISGSETDLNTGDQLQLKIVITPDNTQETSVIWTSSDEAVATVSNGLVTAIGPGTAVITVTSTVNADIYARFTVTVTVSEIIALDDENKVDQSLAQSR